MMRSASNAFQRFNNARAGSPRYPVTINPLLEKAPIPPGYRDLDDVLDELVDDEVFVRLPEKRRQLATDLLPAKVGLRYLRLERGLSQKDLALAVGTSQPRLSVWESSPDSISIVSAKSLATALEVDFNTFFRVVFGD
jgi:hypothetical protein